MDFQDHHLAVRRTARYLTLGDPHTADEVWFVLHGYSQLARSFLRWFVPALRPGRLIVAPEALSRSYFEGKGGARYIGASWMTKEDRDAEIDDYIHYLDAVAADVLGGLSSVPRIEVHGFSQGGATAARWVAHGERAADRVVVWGSMLPPDLDVERFRTNLRGNPVELVLGDQDRYINQEQMQAEIARLRHLQVPVHFTSFAGGHLVDERTLVTLAASDHAA